MRKCIIMAFAGLLLFSSLAFMQTQTESIASAVVAEPQAKCENGFIFVQFKGEDGWFQTTKKCDMRATPPKLDASHASGRLTEAQRADLLRGYLSGHPQPVGKNVCCCQPGWQVYDNASQGCIKGVVRNIWQ